MLIKLNIHLPCDSATPLKVVSSQEGGIYIYIYPYKGIAQMVRNLPAVQETQVQSLGQEDPLEKEILPIPVFLPGEFPGQRGMVGYSLWGCKEPDTTK